MNGLVKRLCVLVLLALCTQTAGAQAVYPNRPIKLIVPFPAGGGIEAVGGSAADFTQKIAEDTARWSKVIKDANITIQ
jgi:tripartite-type tricarboxylate transporter receptor subunit TctC